MTATKVVTRLGDGGETSLGQRTRVRKDAPPIEAVGTIDELAAALGVLRSELGAGQPDEAILRRVQQDLFHVAAALYAAAGGDAPPAFVGERLVLLEHDLDTLNAALPRLANFILPGGSRAAAQAHAARAMARRAERRVVALAESQPADAEILRYLNRLSDFLFVFARHLNADGPGDDVWAPRGLR